MSSQSAITRPSKKVYGITHNLDGSPRIIEPKTLKVGIGLAKGPWIHVYIDTARKWVVQVGKDEFHRFDTKAEAKKYYRTARASAPERKYPQRLPYFTFSRVSPDAIFEPDFDAIEVHGPLPTEIAIVFVKDDPFEASYQMWTATEKKCDGDGINAMRICSMTSTPAEKNLAETAQKAGEKYFPIANGCWMRGCRYSKPDGPNRAPCAPHGRLLFQLVNSPRLGGTSYFDTRGFRSVSQLFSCIETFKGVTGAGHPERGFVAGIPLKMVLRPYKAVHDGKASTQYSVSLEFRAESALALKTSLAEHGVRFRIAANEPLRRLAAAPEVIQEQQPGAPEDEAPIEITAAEMAVEFDGSPAEEETERANLEGLPVDDPDNPGDAAGGDLAHAWDGVPGDPADESILAAQAQSAQGVPAQSTPQGLISKEQAQKIYEYCRTKGLTDAAITRQLGILGCETMTQLTEAASQELTKWAQSFKPGKGK